MSCTNATPPASPRLAMEASIMAPWASVLPRGQWACPSPTRAPPIPSHPHPRCPITAPRPTSILVSGFSHCVVFHSNASVVTGPQCQHLFKLIYLDISMSGFRNDCKAFVQNPEACNPLNFSGGLNHHSGFYPDWLHVHKYIKAQVCSTAFVPPCCK